jgi:hypothetical protein
MSEVDITEELPNGDDSAFTEEQQQDEDVTHDSDQKTRSPNESLVFLYVLDVEMTNISSFKLLLNYVSKISHSSFSRATYKCPL